MPPYINIIYVSCTLIYLSIGMIALVDNRRSVELKIISMFSFSTIAWMLSLYLGFYYAVPGQEELSTMFFRSAFAFASLITAFLVAFFCYFPKKEVDVPRWVKFAYLSVVVALFLASLLTPYVYAFGHVIVDHQLVEDDFGSLYGFYTLYSFLSSATAIWLSYRSFSRSKGIEKKKLAIASVGLALFIGLGIITNVILPIFEVILFQREAVTFSLLFALPAFYSIQKYRFLNFSNVSLNVSRYIILALIFFVAEFLSFKLLHSILPEHLRNSYWGHVISVLIGLWAHDKSERYFPIMVNHNFRDFQHAIKSLKSKIYYITTYPQLQGLLNRTFKSRLNIEGPKVHLLKNSVVETDIPLHLSDEFSNELTGLKGVLVAEEVNFRRMPGERKEMFTDSLSKLGAELCFSIYSSEKLIGFFTLGRKYNNEPYSLEEIEEILKLRECLNVCFMNILLTANLQDEHEVRALKPHSSRDA